MIKELNTKQYSDFLENGGTFKVTLTKNEIGSENFEEFESLKNKLHSGFELPPTATITGSPSNRAMVYQYGGDWDRAVVFVYGQGGKIMYKKTLNNFYEAELYFVKRG